MENKKKIRTFGKVLYVLSVISRVCIIIATFFVALLAIIIPIVFSKVEIDKNRVAIVGIPEARVEIYKDKAEKLNVVVNDKKVDIEKELSSTEKLSADVVFDMLVNTTKESVVVYLEGTAIFGIVVLILTAIALKNFGKFGKNLEIKDEVFEENNSKYLRKTAKFMLIAYVVSFVANGALSGILSDDFNFDFNSVSVVEILVLYLFSYIFAYGHTLEAQKVVIETKEEKPKATRKRKTTKEEK